MKTWMKAALWSVFGLGIIFLLVSVRTSLQSRVLAEPEIHIKVEGENAFLTETELLTRLKQTKKPINIAVYRLFFVESEGFEPIVVYEI